MNEEAMRKYLKKLLSEFRQQFKMLQSGVASTQRNGRNATAATIANLEQRISEISKIIEEAVDEGDAPGVRLEETLSFRDLIVMKMEREQRISEISKIIEETDENDSPRVRLEETPSFRDLILMKMERQRAG